MRISSAAGTRGGLKCGGAGYSISVGAAVTGNAGTAHRKAHCQNSRAV